MMEPILPWLLLIVLQLPHGQAVVNIAQFETKEDCEFSAVSSLETWREKNPKDTTTSYICKADSKHST